EDGSQSSLDLSLRWEGLVLKDVELRRDFMSELLGLPVDVPHAFVRRAVLHLPWYTLMLGSVVAKLEGVTIVMRGDASTAKAAAAAAATAAPRDSDGAAAPQRGGGDGSDGHRHDQGPGSSCTAPPQQQQQQQQRAESGSSGRSRSRTGRQKQVPRWLKWILRRLKVKLVDVTLRYESVGMCPLQGAPAAAIEVTLGSLEVQPVSLQGASAWFQQQARAQQKSQQHQYREELLLRGLAVSVEPLVDPPSPLPPPAAGATTADNAGTSS
ncbi:unnamed protein product, partial [Pylaiella littoralis]